jgi:hypothetical protein
LKAKGIELREYPIPQDSWTARFVMGGVEWRVLNFTIDRCCCEQDWTAEVAIVDKLGWEKEAYGDFWFAEKVAGTSREFERGRFSVSGSINCCK